MDKATAVSTVVAAVSCSVRLKREDCRRTKHDSVFSHWKVLIGPTDWEDHSQGKEGAERYRIQNLPNCTSCPGIYELGVIVAHYQHRRDTAKLDPNSVIPVYLGKSDNVRNRLQQYGRDGAHLESGSLTYKLDDGICTLLPQSGPGLFKEMFSKGLSIVYRWAPMKTSRDALKTESDLLGTFDYAWNKDSNGPRRREDILKKIDCSSKASQFLAKYSFLPIKAKGIKIKIFEPPLMDNGDTFHTELPSTNIFHHILKFGRLRPKLILPWRSGVNGNPSICGVALGHGVICKSIPADGRKRCEEHRGMKVNGDAGKLITDGNLAIDAGTNLPKQQISPVCGVIMGDGSICARVPFKENKRCLEHKGQRIRNSTSKSVGDKELYVQRPILHEKLDQNFQPCFPDRSTASLCEHEISREGNTICGVDMKNGTFCTRQPLEGRKRCEEHKGMRIKKTNSKSFTEQISSVYDSCDAKNLREASHMVIPSVVSDIRTPNCGAVLHDGVSCKRLPVEGNRRCCQHKGVVQNHRNISHNCGAALKNGSFCRRKPSEGNDRCWQHKGTKTSTLQSSSAIDPIV